MKNNKIRKLLIPTALIIGLFIYAYYFYKTETKENFAGENEYRIGSSLIEKKEYDRAIRHLDKSLEINPDIEAAFLSRGIALMMMNKFDESKKNFDKAISMNNDFAEAYANRGILNDKTGNYKEAIEDYRRAAKLKPKLLEGPGRIWKFLRNIHEDVPNILDRANYLENELKKSGKDRKLKNIEEDSKQRMYTPK